MKPSLANRPLLKWAVVFVVLIIGVPVLMVAFDAFKVLWPPWLK